MSRDMAFPLIMFKHMRDIYWLRNSSLLSKNCFPMGPTKHEQALCLCEETRSGSDRRSKEESATMESSSFVLGRFNRGVSAALPAIPRRGLERRVL